MARFFTVLVTFIITLCSSCSIDANRKHIYVEIPYDDSYGFPIITAMINNRPYRFIIRTGSPDTFITDRIVDEELLRKKNRNARGSKNNKAANFQNTRKEEPLGIVDRMNIDIQGFSFSLENAYIIEKDSYIFKCYEIDGSIGGEFFKDYIVKFNGRAKSITLTTDSTYLTSCEQQWNDLLLWRSVPFCKVWLNETTFDNFSFDSGNASGCVILDSIRYSKYYSSNILQSSNEEVASGVGYIGIYGQHIDCKIHRTTLDTLGIGGYMFHRVPVRSSCGDFATIAFKLVNYGDIILDYPNKRYCFTPYDINIEWPDVREKIVCRVQNSMLIVSMIWDKTLSEQMDIEDRIVMIGDQQFYNIDECSSTKLENLAKQHSIPLNSLVTFEKINGKRYLLPLEMFL